MTTTEQNIDQILIPILEKVSDPEIPVLSIMDMGVVRSAVIKNNIVKVEITPTYSGCPAMDVIGDDIKLALKQAGYESKVELILHKLNQCHIVLCFKTLASFTIFLFCFP